ncbi:lysophospholipase catalytic domain-containing protein [Annulohypoxylon maeteangense]|uniref:lysophospholipase catalytic domain-containing protein n=1 Tax=Annulohypoxylon maeteangense TaxID=1927788 RepID=UPI002008AC44|nr:lysophospholipase catalytic domain-containing protein [Annulohypoxylon maeteangense]KAI0881495.1 lysophospholipase catalytic domain-containing protein [Annulohypoxylon maeteangense]
MHFLPVTLVSLISAALGSPTGGSDGFGEVAARDILLGRASPENPSGTYAPAFVDCPQQRPTIRSASSLSQSEQDWLKNRRSKTVDPLVQFLRKSNLTDYDYAGYITSNSQNFSVVPNIGIAVSGGGYRALMNGAGFIAAADSRVPGSTDTGGIGGLLQSSTYLAGLSGGGWLVGSIFANNFSTVVQLRDGYQGSALWQFSNSIFQGPKSRGISIVNTVSYWDDILNQVDDKRNAGYDVSITDYWGRALSVQLINATDGGPAYTFSSIADASNFKSADTPMPILVADERRPNTKVISLNSTVYEFNPWEIGSHDPTVYGFAPIRYVGSNFSGGSIPDSGHCVEGFDAYSYVMGTSSSLFNAFLLQNLSSSDIPTVVTNAIRDLLTHIGDENDDIAAWNPNPFLGYNNDTNASADDEQLTLVDGGLDLQNIPLHPLLQPSRGLDVIFAVDSSADTGTNFPNGTALRATYDRSKTDIANGTVFPAVPDAETFINLELNKRPTFFGCNTSEFSNASHIPPLIVYVPNAPYTIASNVSTFDPSYSDAQRNSIIKNGFNVATMGNGTVDSEWTACVACAVLSRSLERTGTTVSATCQRCFSRYCWNGTTDSRPVSSYEPTPILQFDTQSSGVSPRSGAGKGLVFGVVGIAALALAF